MMEDIENEKFKKLWRRLTNWIIAIFVISTTILVLVIFWG